MSSSSSFERLKRSNDDGDNDGVAPVVARAAARPVTHTNGKDVPRRSGRERISTVMQIQGETVLRKNNYVVKGMGYEFGAYEEDVKKKASIKAKKATAPRPAKKPRKEDPLQTVRLMHNDQVKAQVVQKQVLRQAFLARHVDLLKPFLEEEQSHTTTTTSSKSSKHSVLQTLLRVQQEQQGKPVYQPKEILVQPDLLNGNNVLMRDYQMLGLQFMVNCHHQNLGMILGDEMGLGKTLQTISLLCYLKEQAMAAATANKIEMTPSSFPTSLVICPLTVLDSWNKELQKWAPSLKVLRVHSSDTLELEAQRKALTQHAHEYDVIITTYEMAKVPALTHAWSRLVFSYLVLDEGHKIKNHLTQISQAVRKIHCENRLLLTGTPLQNNLVELWSLLNFLYPEIFTTSEPFESAFNITENIVDKEKLEQAHQLLEKIMIRRLKTQVEKLMPIKLETKVYCPLSKTQIFWYKTLLMKDWAALEKISDRAAATMTADGETKEASLPISNRNMLANLMMQLRKCCLHPFLFDGAEEDIDATTVEEMTGASGKLAVLDQLLIRLFQTDHRCVLFSQFTSMLDIIEDYCRLRGWGYCRLDGSTSRAQRNYLVERFNSKDPPSPYFIFLMSTKSGGMGLNLQSADTCILFDSDWNPQSDIQAMARVHRIGQTRTVHVYRLISSGTVEERIVERADKKLLLDQMVNRADNGTSAAASMHQMDGNSKAGGGLSAMDLLADIKFGCQAVFDSSQNNDLPTADEIIAITDRNRTESDSAGRLRGNETKSAAGFDATKALTDTQAFGGIDFRSLRAKQKKKEEKALPKSLRGIAHLWKEVSVLQNSNKKREVKQRIVQVQGIGSGYGSATVPVLASNNYSLEHGEESVFKRELSHQPSAAKAAAVPSKKKMNNIVPEHQDFCQNCGDGGRLLVCSRCPIAVHQECCDYHKPKSNYDLFSCFHHRCVDCGRNGAQAGGILFPCESCPRAYCEDCLPKPGTPGFRILGACDRFEALDFDSTKKGACSYIHCSQTCQEVAVDEFGWDPAKLFLKAECPPPIDVSENFGTKSAILEELTKAEEKMTASSVTTGKRGAQNAQGPSAASSGLPTIAMVDSMSARTRYQYLAEWGCPTPKSFEGRGREMRKYIRSVSNSMASSASEEEEIIDLMSDSDDSTPPPAAAAAPTVSVTATVPSTKSHAAAVAVQNVARPFATEIIEISSSDSEGETPTHQNRVSLSPAT